MLFVAGIMKRREITWWKKWKKNEEEHDV